MLLEAFYSANFRYSNLSNLYLHSSHYIRWLRDPGIAKYIEGAREDYSIDDLNKFIEDKNNSDDALLLGIFDKVSEFHIGNIKYEPINFTDKSAWLGVLIGEGDFRGKGHSFEIISETMGHISDCFGITKFYLGVNAENERAFRAYLRLGFTELGPHEKGGVVMEKRF